MANFIFLFLQTSLLQVQTADNLPPVFTILSVNKMRPGNADLVVATNKASQIHYMVLLQSDTGIPTVANV